MESPSKIRGYTTDIRNDYAVDFIKRPRHKPLFVYLAHKALHPK